MNNINLNNQNMYIESIFISMGVAAKSLITQALIPSWMAGGGLLLIDDQITNGLIKEHLHIGAAFEWFYFIAGGLAILITLLSRALKLRREWLQQEKDFKDLD